MLCPSLKCRSFGLGSLACRSFTCLMLGFLLFAWSTPSSIATAQTAPPELPEAAERIAAELETLPPVRDEPTVPLPAERPDPNAPVLALRSARDTLRDLAAAPGRRGNPDLAPVLRAAEEAMRVFNAGSPDLSHLAASAGAVAVAQRGLADLIDAGGPRELVHVRNQLTGATHRIATDMIGVAERSGVRPQRLRAAKRRVELGLKAAKRGDHVGAANHMGGGTKLAANTVSFDVDLFEQNIIDALAGQTVGYAFSIGWQGNLYNGGSSLGLARTDADEPSRNQSPNKEMHVASVSKTLTAIVILRLLEENNLTPDSLIAPWLPGDWAVGAGVESQTFEDYLTHESGFAQKGAGNDYAALQAAIAQPLGSTGFQYSNANYGLMRVLSARLQGFDVSTIWWFPPDALSTGLFLSYAQGLFESIGVEVDCRVVDADPTIQYNFPHNDQPGYLEPDRRMTCGGVGWTISSNEIGAVLANLRYTENLVSAEARDWMTDRYLGFNDPANYGWVVGDMGTYSMHGGDWGHGPGEAHACAVMFPIQAEAGLVINSERGGSMAYQCSLLRNAFDDAWTAD